MNSGRGAFPSVVLTVAERLSAAPADVHLFSQALLLDACRQAPGLTLPERAVLEQWVCGAQAAAGATTCPPASLPESKRASYCKRWNIVPCLVVSLLIVAAIFLTQTDMRASARQQQHQHAMRELQLSGTSSDDTYPALGSIFLAKRRNAATRRSNSTSSSGGAATDVDNRTMMHALFLGDSVMRYSYLALAYFVHTGRVDVPQFLIQESASRHFNHFFHRSTRSFAGAMACDCYRMTKCPKLDKVCRRLWSQTAHENREYRHPSLPVVLTFMQVWGDHPMVGSIEPWNLRNGTITDVPRNFTYRLTLEDTLKTVIPTLQPKVTHIALNIGQWPHAAALASIDSILAALSHAAPMTVWRETAPRRTAMWAATNHAAASSAGKSSAASSSASAKSPTTASTRDANVSAIDAAARRLCSPLGRLRCVYAPFSIEVAAMDASDWWDEVHLSARTNQRMMADLWRRMVAGTSPPSLKAALPLYPAMEEQDLSLLYDNVSDFGINESLSLRRRGKAKKMNHLKK